MKKNYSFLIILIFCKFSFAQRLIFSGFGGTGNCDGTLNITACMANPTINFSGPGNHPNAFIQNNLCAGTYTITIVDANTTNIYSASLTYTNSGQVIVGPGNGTSVFSSFATIAQPTNTTNCNGSIFLDIQGGIPSYSIQWYNTNNQLISGQTNDTLLNVCPNGYGFKVTDNSPSCNTAGITSLPLSTEILSLKKTASSSLFPNPSNGLFKLELNNFDETKKIEILDVLGKVIKNIEVENQKNILIDLSDQVKGVYLIRIIDAIGISSTNKAIKN